ncbi:hypothetical protein [Motilimonas pumila]|uniref:Uncharacterized protein n=1 Tax=Motilimonas pumila TaxID=2303987 RepID=A0A418YF94_9GAMM|nr:hypothetical protein [Motilimonas pumila]RJG47935.1 hypothetical protein D1Z90_09485 [Motilimonas pumila]
MIGKVAAYMPTGRQPQHAGIITFFNKKTDEVTIRDFDGSYWNGWFYQVQLVQSEQPETLTS